MVLLNNPTFQHWFGLTGLKLVFFLFLLFQQEPDFSIKYTIRFICNSLTSETPVQ